MYGRGDIHGHILVLFDVHADKLLTVRAVRLTPLLEISEEEEDWTQYIRIPYVASTNVEPLQNNEDTDDELVELFVIRICVQMQHSNKINYERLKEARLFRK